MRKRDRSALLDSAMEKFCSMTDGREKKEFLNFLRQTYGNKFADKCLKRSPSFKY